MKELSEVHYDAFISYRHSDLDSFVAESLHRKLESFRLPRTVRKGDGNGKTRIERVFRDVDELTLSDNLSEPINIALANSDYLITVCTPRYLESAWCMKEIEVFLQTHDRDHVLVVLAEDEPCNSFPEILTYEEFTSTDENGKEIRIRREKEPLAADVRGSNRKEIGKAIDNAVIRLCAPIFGLKYDDLRQRHREQRIRRLAAVFGSIGAAVLAFAIFATVMLIKIGRQNEKISEQYDELQEKYAGSMAIAANDLLEVGRRMDAVYAARSVLPDKPAGLPNAAALQSLYAAMNIYSVSERYAPVCTYQGAGEIYSYDVTADGEYLLLNDQRNIRIFETDTGERIRSIKWDSDPEEFSTLNARFCGNEGVMIVDGDSAYYTPIEDRNRETIGGIGRDAVFFSSPDGQVLLVFSADRLFAFDASAKELYSIDMGEELQTNGIEIRDVVFNNGKYVCSMVEGSSFYILIVGQNDGVIYSRYSGTGDPWAVQLDGNDLYVSITQYDGNKGRFTTKVYRYDRRNETEIWQRELPGFTPDRMMIAGDYIYVCNYGTIIVLAREDGVIEDTLSSGGGVLCSWDEDGACYYLNDNGELYSYGSWASCVNETDSCFMMCPSKDLQKAVIAGGDLYLWNFRSDYVVRYSKESSEWAELSDEEANDYLSEPEYALEELSEALPEGEELPDIAEYSEDEKLIFAIFPDNEIRIYDGGTLELLNSFNVNGYPSFESFFYLNTTDCYVLSGYDHSYLLDENYDVFCVLEGSVYDEEDGELILRSPNWDLYRVTWVGYEELLKLADEYLNGYEPSERIRQEYNIQ